VEILEGERNQASARFVYYTLLLAFVASFTTTKGTFKPAAMCG
jgi:hypothetical protein